MTITDSTISGNTATGSSGGGGGIDNNSSGTLTITNSTISGNAVTGNSWRRWRHRQQRRADAYQQYRQRQCGQW